MAFGWSAMAFVKFPFHLCANPAPDPDPNPVPDTDPEPHADRAADRDPERDVADPHQVSGRGRRLVLRRDVRVEVIGESSDVVDIYLVYGADRQYAAEIAYQVSPGNHSYTVPDSLEARVDYYVHVVDGGDQAYRLICVGSSVPPTPAPTTPPSPLPTAAPTSNPSSSFDRAPDVEPHSAPTAPGLQVLGPRTRCA